MRVVPKTRLNRFWKSPGRADAEGPLRAWYTHINSKTVLWRSWGDVKTSFKKASIVGDCVVFNIGGNKYRLIAEINYERGKLFVRHVLTHADYSRGAWKKN